MWEVYLQLFGALRVLDAIPQMITVTTIDTDNRGLLLPLLADHEDLPMVEARDGTYYMGGVHGGLGLGEYNQLDYLALIPSFPQAPNIYIA